MGKEATIKIIGAGISGLTAAINLADHGFNVEVYEQYPDVGCRFHGDFQGLENWSSKDDVLDVLRNCNIDINFEYQPFDSFVLSDAARDKNICFDRASFYLVRRGRFEDSLDIALKEQALKKGVDIKFKKTLLSTDADIIATGPRKGEIVAIAKGKTFECDMPDGAYALVDEAAAIKGYGYLLITKGRGCLCTVLFDKFPSVKKCYDRTEKLLSRYISSSKVNAKDVGGRGSFSVNPEYIRDNVMLVGEAAGLQDMLWGFGMRTAFRSGYLAAKAIIDSGGVGSVASGEYQRNACKEFRRYLQAGVVNRYLWESCNSKLYPILSLFLKGEKMTSRILKSFYNYNCLQKIIYPIALRRMRDRYPQLRW